MRAKILDPIWRRSTQNFIQGDKGAKGVIALTRVSGEGVVGMGSGSGSGSDVSLILVRVPKTDRERL